MNGVILATRMRPGSASRSGSYGVSQAVRCKLAAFFRKRSVKGETLPNLALRVKATALRAGAPHAGCVAMAGKETLGPARAQKTMKEAHYRSDHAKSGRTTSRSSRGHASRSLRNRL